MNKMKSLFLNTVSFCNYFLKSEMEWPSLFRVGLSSFMRQKIKLVERVKNTFYIFIFNVCTYDKNKKAKPVSKQK